MLLAGKLAAQPFQSIFGDSSTVWRCQVGNICDVFCSDSVYVEKDTLINGLSYKKAIACTFSPYCVVGYLREDTALGKVWFLDWNFDSEVVALDFSKNVGDTLHIGYWQPALTVTNVYYNNGRKHIVYDADGQTTCSDLDFFTVIEGIGSNAGLFPKGSYVPHGFLFGVIKDNVVEYINPEGYNLDLCLLDVAEEQALSKLFTIYPNPASNEVSINIKTIYSKPLVRIYNAMGSLMGEQILPGAGVHTIATNNLSNGLYFISLYNDSQLIGNRKLIIAN